MTTKNPAIAAATNPSTADLLARIEKESADQAKLNSHLLAKVEALEARANTTDAKIDGLEKNLSGQIAEVLAEVRKGGGKVADPAVNPNNAAAVARELANQQYCDNNGKKIVNGAFVDKTFGEKAWDFTVDSALPVVGIAGGTLAVTSVAKGVITGGASWNPFNHGTN